MSAIPYICCAIANGSLAIASEKIYHHGLMSRKNVRRVFNGIGNKQILNNYY